MINAFNVHSVIRGYMIEGLILKFFILLSSVFSVGIDKDFKLNDWEITHNWSQIDNTYYFEANNSTLINKCQESPDSKILFPQIIHGVHQIWGDEILLKNTGDVSFKVASPFYEQPTIDCKIISQFKNIQWKVYSYSYFFSRIIGAPHLVDNNFKFNFFNSYLNMIAASVLILVSAFSALVCFGRIQKKLANSIIFGGVFFSFYFLLSENVHFGIYQSMLTAHKIADLSLIIGVLLYFYTFVIHGVLESKLYKVQAALSFASIFIILFGSSGDAIQFGTILSMPMFLISSLRIFMNIRFNLSNVFDKIRTLTLALLLLTGINDILHVFGIINSFTILSVGIVGAISGLSFAAYNELKLKDSQSQK